MVRDDSYRVRKNFEKSNISYPLIRARYQGVKNVSFFEDYAYVLNE